MKGHIITIVVGSIVLIVLGFFTLGQDIQAAGTMVIEIQCIDTGVGAHANASARGTVFDAEPKENEKFNIIAGASISLTANNATKTGTTDSDGDFDISNLPAGWWGDKTINYTVTKSGFDTLEGNFTCSPKPCDEDPDGCPAGGVGGIIELLDVAGTQLESSEPSSSRNFIPYIAVAAVLGMIIIVTCFQYIGRRKV